MVGIVDHPARRAALRDGRLERYLSPADYLQAHREMIAATATTPAEVTTEHADRAPVASSP